MKRLLLSFLLFIAVASGNAQQVIQHGHAHNDYMHKRPLFEALESGFTSIEIDVFLHNNDLIVSHMATGLDKKMDIEEEYLKPIQKIIRENGGQVYKNYAGPVIFMIDIKTSADPTYAKLKEILDRYKDILAVYSHDSLIKAGPIHILLSGSKPYDKLLSEQTSYATLDGDIKNIKEPKYRSTITRYSDPWGLYFTWTGVGPIPEEEKERLDTLVRDIHQQGKQIRFYGAPDKEAVWRVLLNAHVDWVSTDKLKEYAHFYALQFPGK